MTPKIKIVAALRRLWVYYGENRKAAIKASKVEGGYLCCNCGVIMKSQKHLKVDHIINLTRDMRETMDWNLYIERLFEGELQIMCKECHDKKTLEERQMKSLYREALEITHLVYFDSLRIYEQFLPRLSWLLNQGFKVDDNTLDINNMENIRKKYLTKKGKLKKTFTDKWKKVDN